MATQLKKVVMPVQQPVQREKARVITEEEKKFNAFIVLRQARANKRLFGRREKKKREAEDKDKQKCYVANAGNKKVCAISTVYYYCGLVVTSVKQLYPPPKLVVFQCHVFAVHIMHLRKHEWNEILNKFSGFLKWITIRFEINMLGPGIV